MLPRTFFDGITEGVFAIFLYPLFLSKGIFTTPATQHTEERNQPNQPNTTEFFIEKKHASKKKSF